MSCWPAEGTKSNSFILFGSTINGQNTFEAEQMLIQKEEAQEEFDYLHKLFVRGYSAIQHPHKPDVTERRKESSMIDTSTAIQSI